MYIPPNSTIEIFSGVKLDKSYQQTIYFSNEGEQNTFFETGKNNRFTFLMGLDDSQFVRHTNNSVRVAVNANALLSANYMRFYNPSYTTQGQTLRPQGKWFYCFVDSVEYVNEDTTLVSYTVDVMQTWFVGGEFLGCLIERHHTNSDNLYEHILREPITVDNYIVNNNDVVHYDFTRAVYWFLSVNPKIENNDFVLEGVDIAKESGGYNVLCSMPSALTVIGHYIDGIYENPDGITFQPIGEYVAMVIDNDPKLTNAVINLTTAPAAFLSSDNSKTLEKITTSVVTEDAKVIARGETINGYTPKNNKLFTSQFVTVCVSNNRGDVNKYLPEFFSSGNRSFVVRHYMSADPISLITPTNYNKDVLGNGIDYLTCDYPDGSYSKDSYATWKAVNRGANAVAIAGAVGSTALSVASMVALPANASAMAKVNVAGKGVSSAGDILSLAATYYDKSNEPNKVVGKNPHLTQLYGGIPITDSRYVSPTGFSIYETAISTNDAKMVDDYLSRYGYSVNLYGVPFADGFPSARNKFYYIKTNGFVIVNAPSKYAEQISQILDNGITFWKSEAYNDFGVYNDDTFKANSIKKG